MNSVPKPALKLLLPPDGQNWLKYGQKVLSRSGHQRYYYKCVMFRVTGCPAKRIVDFPIEDPSRHIILIRDNHNHSFPEAINSDLTPEKEKENAESDDQSASEANQTVDHFSLEQSVIDLMFDPGSSEINSTNLASSGVHSALDSFMLDPYLRPEIGCSSQDYQMANPKMSSTKEDNDGDFFEQENWDRQLMEEKLHLSRGFDLSDMLRGTGHFEGAVKSPVENSVSPVESFREFQNDERDSNLPEDCLAPLPPNRPSTEYIFTPVGIFFTGLRK